MTSERKVLFLTLYFQLVQGNSAFRAGLFILPAAATVMVGAPIAGALTEKFAVEPVSEV